MKYFLVFALVALVAARPDGGDRKPRPRPDGGDRKPRPRPERPEVMVLVDRVHNATQGETYQFQFGIAAVEQLDKAKVHLFKIERGDKRPVFKKTDFEISLETKTQEEMGEDCPFDKGDGGDQADDQEDKPQPTNAILGSVSVTSVSCDDQGLYLVRYGRLPKPREDKDEDDKKRPEPREKRGEVDKKRKPREDKDKGEKKRKPSEDKDKGDKKGPKPREDKDKGDKKGPKPREDKDKGDKKRKPREDKDEGDKKRKPREKRDEGDKKGPKPRDDKDKDDKKRPGVFVIRVKGCKRPEA